MSAVEHAPAGGRPEEEDEEALALKAFLARIRGRNEVPAFVKNVEQINVVTLNPKAKVQLLNDAITSDVALTLKVLKVANSAIYASAGRTVQTVHQAIMLLGFERMKDISVSAAVFEHVQREGPDLRELLACSVLTANQALVLSGRAGYPRAEIAYLCGIFRNLGEIVCATYAPKEYAAYKALPQGEDDPGATAERQAFGFRFDDLGRAIATEWRLPESVTSAMMRPPANAVGRADGIGALTAITQLAADLTDSVYRSAPVTQRAKLRQAIERYGQGLGVDEAAALDAARDALAESETALRSAGTEEAPTAFLERLEYLHEQVIPPKRDEGYVPRRPPSGPLMGPRTPSDRPSGTWGFGDDGSGPPTIADATRTAAQFRDAVRNERPLSMDEAIERTLGALLGVGYQRAALLLSADGHTRLRVRTVIGEGHEYLRDGMVVTLAPPNGALALALGRGEDVIADVRGSSKYRADPSIKRVRSATFAALPVIVGGQPIGALFADHMRASLDQGPEFHTVVREVRDTLQLAFERLRELAARGAASVSGPQPAVPTAPPAALPRAGAA